MPQAGGEGALAGLADISWGDLSHAYGSAGDVPGLLRAVASGDAEAAGNAVLELFGNIWHQGTVYQATPWAVPFLARMAAAGIRAGDLVQLLGCIAESADDVTGGRARLRDLADRPRRVIGTGAYDDIIRKDEALRTALRDLLRDLGEPGGHGA